MNIEKAMEIAALWAAGKMVGADPEEVAAALYQEVVKVREKYRDLLESYEIKH
jgi:hypothetical protein